MFRLHIDLFFQPGYRNPTKYGYKIFGTEANVRKCLIDVMNQMFKYLNRPTTRNENENNDQQLGTTNTEKYDDARPSAGMNFTFEAF